MNPALVDLFRYNGWANQQVIGACRALTPEHLQFRAPGTSGSIAELLVHVVGGQQTFVLRTNGRQHEGELSRQSPWPGFETLSALAASSSDDLTAIAEAFEREEDVALPYMGTAYRFPKSFFLVHAIEHGVEHRTEVNVALAVLGMATADLDGWVYATAAGYGAET